MALRITKYLFQGTQGQGAGFQKAQVFVTASPTTGIKTEPMTGIVWNAYFSERFEMIEGSITEEEGPFVATSLINNALL